MKWVPERPFSLEVWADRFTRWGDDPVNVVQSGVYHRVVDGTPYRARQNTDGAILLDGDLPEAAMVSDLQLRTADGLDWGPVLATARDDDRVRALVERHAGFRPVITPDPWEAVVGLITAQQVNLRWALEIKSRLVRRFGTLHHVDGVDVWEFPSASRLRGVDPMVLREMQWTTRKAEYVVGLSGERAHDVFLQVPGLGNSEAVAVLTSLRGIGRWTAEQLLARCWARPDVASPGDLGVRKAVSFHWHSSDDLLSEEVVRETTSSWGDARNLLSQLLLEEL